MRILPPYRAGSFCGLLDRLGVCGVSIVVTSVLESADGENKSRCQSRRVRVHRRVVIVTRDLRLWPLAWHNYEARDIWELVLSVPTETHKPTTYQLPTRCSSGSLFHFVR